MELLLNLALVLLGLPAYWLWRRRAGARAARRFDSLQVLLALGCALVLLFPVISASDDLHAMRAEMEDSSINKRTVRQAGSDKSSAWISRWQVPPAAAAGGGRLVGPAERLTVGCCVAGCHAAVCVCCLWGAGSSPPLPREVFLTPLMISWSLVA